jgi:transposase
MAYREIEMWEILEVLRRVRRWVRVAAALGWAPLLQEPDEALARQVARRMRPVSADRPAGESERQLAPHREQIRAWLAPGDDGRGLRLSKVHQLLIRQGVDVPYSSLHRFATQFCGFRDERRITVRVAEVPPGELAEVDFGRLGLVPDPATGKRRTLHALVVTLVHSRHQYVHVTHTQTLADLIEGLEDAWAYFGGVPARVVLDNLKAAVTKPDRYDATFQRTFAEYARHRGFVIDAAMPRHPQGKPHVERQVPYVRESFFRGETWLDRDHVQREVVRWCTEIAGLRTHGTTRQRPLDVFEAVERDALAPLVRPRFDPPTWRQCKVHPDHHIQFQKALYSVPTRHVGKRVTVRGDSKLVRIYVGGECIKTHTRVAEGKRSTDYRDYPPERAHYALRDPQAAIREAKRHGEAMGRFAERLLAGPVPWSRLRQAQKLLRLGHRFGFDRVDAACRRALAELPARFLRPRPHFTHLTEEPIDGSPSRPQDASQTPQALGHPSDAARPGRLRPQDKAP